MLRATALALLVAALTLAPAVRPSDEHALVATGAVAHASTAAPPALAEVPPCAPTPEARVDVARGYVALRWDACEGIDGYRVLRGEAGGALEELVEVRHASHVDVGLAPGASYVYAVLPVGAGLPAALREVAVHLA